MKQPTNTPVGGEISPDYVMGLVQRIENLEKQDSISKDKLKYFCFYILVCIFIIINFIMATCEFNIGCIHFKGLKDWGGAISVLVPEMIFILIFGARTGIDHLGYLLDKVVSFRK